MIDLDEDYARAVERETPAQFKRLRQLQAPYFVTTVRAMPDGPATWQPDDAGRVYMLFPVWDRPIADPYAPAGPWLDINGDIPVIVDLAIWRPDEPGTILLRAQAVDAIGETALDWPSGPLYLTGNPLAYWREHGRGACIIDWHACQHRLLGHQDIICDDLATAELVEHHTEAGRRALTPARPSIGIIEAPAQIQAP